MDPSDNGGPLIIAHRGASALAPENTLAAFQRAVGEGANGIEFDVRLASDGVPVVIHDGVLNRVAAMRERVADLASDDLASIDVGSWFNRLYPELAQPDFAKQTVPSLADTLAALADFTGVIYVELKCESKDEADRLSDSVASVIRDSALLPQMIVKSFRLRVIPRIRFAVPEVKTAALFAPQVMRFLRKEKYMIDIAREFGADHLSMHRSLIGPKLMRKAARAGLPVTVWTVNKPHWYERAAKLGLFAVITNDPAKLVSTR